MLHLYHHNMSAAATKVRIALYEKDLAWTGTEVNLMGREHLAPDYLRINPRGVVPALDHDGKIVIESAVILEYLEDAFPEVSLRPKDPEERADMRMWMRLPDEGLHSACGSLTFVAAFAEQVRAHHTFEQWQERLASYPDKARAQRQIDMFDKGFESSYVKDAVQFQDRVLADVDRALQSKRWLASDDFSLADVSIVPYVTRLERLGLERMWANRPHVARWFDAVRARHSFDLAITNFPSNEYDDELKKRNVDVWPQVSALRQPLLGSDA